MTANLFLAAAPRCGSTQLAHWLDSHPDIFLSPIKEPNFFSAHEFPPAFVEKTHLNDVAPEKFVGSNQRKPAQFAVFRRPEDYAALFAAADCKWRMDASTTYLTCAHAPANIHAYNPDARIIILTRDPLARALSHYRLAIRTGRTRRSLTAELLDEMSGITPLAGRFLVRPSCYKIGIARFRAVFPEPQIMCIRFETMIKNPGRTLRSVCRFLQVDTAKISMANTARNHAVAPVFPALNHFLWHSGLKTKIRRHLPNSLKPAIKRLYFKRFSVNPFQDDEIKQLAAALNGAA